MSRKTQSINTTLVRWRPDRPFNTLRALPPQGIDIESKPILRRCIDARAAVAELKQAAGLIPDQSMLIGTIPLLEAQASSEIENIVTTNDRLFQMQSSEEHADPATKEAMRYRNAMLEGFRSLAQNPLCTSTAEAICTRIKGVEMRVRKVPGTALGQPGSSKVIYTPPEGEQRLRDMLDDWARFMNRRTELDPLIKMAVGHYQFEAIHPFTDGNGRTGRILNSLFLIQEGLLNLPVLYLSRYIIQNKPAYYQSLLGVTANREWEAWILYMLKGVALTAMWTTIKIREIRTLFDVTSQHVRATRPKIYSHELVTLLFKRPYCRIQDVVHEGIASRQTASRYLKELANVGVLAEQKIGREKLFVHPRLMKLLTSDSDDVESYPTQFRPRRPPRAALDR